MSAINDLVRGSFFLENTNVNGLIEMSSTTSQKKKKQGKKGTKSMFGPSFFNDLYTLIEA